jgi:hypothetical protein
VGAILILPFFYGFDVSSEYLEGVAMASLHVGFAELMIGFFTYMFRGGETYGRAITLCGALALLTSFTMCSTGMVPFAL